MREPLEGGGKWVGTGEAVHHAADCACADAHTGGYERWKTLNFKQKGNMLGGVGNVLWMVVSCDGEPGVGPSNCANIAL